MCGIIGYVGDKVAAPLLLEGLKRLKYRGYDSAGIATLENGEFFRLRSEGKIEELETKLSKSPLPGTIGIGHTRWATHGIPVERNAHPHLNTHVAVVHNGIIENFSELYETLKQQGVIFETETDTEVIIHLLSSELLKGHTPEKALLTILPRLRGAYALAVLFKDVPDSLYAVRQGPPLAIGHGQDEMFIGSDALALAGFTQHITYLEDGDIAHITKNTFSLFDATGTILQRPIRQTLVSGNSVEKGEYRHFMLKEIHEQPNVVADTLTSYIHPATHRIGLPPFPASLESINRIIIVACGTSYYAGMIAKYWLETFVGLPVEVDIASEYRYREGPIDAHTLALFISQSGETADTLAAFSYAKQNGALCVAVVNVPESSLDRLADVTLLTHAGPEIGVASTKAFTCQLSVLAACSLGIAEKLNKLSPEQEKTYVENLQTLPLLLSTALETEKKIQDLAHKIHTTRDVLFLGRHLLYPVALEGALKLKEISYIHAEGYAAGELKHGPIALIDNALPVIVLAPSSPYLEKVFSNTQEIMARGAQILLFGDKESLQKFPSSPSIEPLILPKISTWLSPILYALPVQLLAYYTAVLKGTDVDQPRNLAKSVTVE